jgi:hypothetical protein
MAGSITRIHCVWLPTLNTPPPHPPPCPRTLCPVAAVGAGDADVPAGRQTINLQGKADAVREAYHILLGNIRKYLPNLPPGMVPPPLNVPKSSYAPGAGAAGGRGSGAAGGSGRYGAPAAGGDSRAAAYPGAPPPPPRSYR